MSDQEERPVFEVSAKHGNADLDLVACIEMCFERGSDDVTIQCGDETVALTPENWAKMKPEIAKVGRQQSRTAAEKRQATMLETLASVIGLAEFREIEPDLEFGVDVHGNSFGGDDWRLVPLEAYAALVDPRLGEIGCMLDPAFEQVPVRIVNRKLESRKIMSGMPH